jgi:hypothetical protein
MATPARPFSTIVVVAPVRTFTTASSARTTPRKRSLGPNLRGRLTIAAVGNFALLSAAWPSVEFVVAITSIGAEGSSGLSVDTVPF